jgi:hypothetical protein
MEIQDTPTFSQMQTVKRRLFAMRNGIIADTLRKGGSPFRIIFGLNLPQLVDIAADTPHSAELARQLWANTSTRESLLLAPMLFPAEEMTRREALQWMHDVTTVEVADILCHRLLRHLDFAISLAEECSSDSVAAITRYVGLRLIANIMYKHPQEAMAYAKREKNRHEPMTERVADMVIDETSFILGEG